MEMSDPWKERDEISRHANYMRSRLRLTPVDLEGPGFRCRDRFSVQSTNATRNRSDMISTSQRKPAGSESLLKGRAQDQDRGCDPSVRKPHITFQGEIRTVTDQGLSDWSQRYWPEPFQTPDRGGVGPLGSRHPSENASLHPRLPLGLFPPPFTTVARLPRRLPFPDLHTFRLCRSRSVVWNNRVLGG